MPCYGGWNGNGIAYNKTNFFENGSYESATALVRAVKLCERFKTHIPFTDLKTKIKDYNAIILATSSQEYILSADDVLFNCETRKKNLLVIDLGVPRNADPSIGAIDGVTLACIDDLKTTADRHLQERENEIGEIECIIEEQVREFTRWYMYRSGCECGRS